MLRFLLGKTICIVMFKHYYFQVAFIEVNVAIIQLCRSLLKVKNDPSIRVLNRPIKANFIFAIKNFIFDLFSVFFHFYSFFFFNKKPLIFGSCVWMMFLWHRHFMLRLWACYGDIASNSSGNTYTICRSDVRSQNNWIVE